MFKEYDKDKTGLVKEVIKTLMTRLYNDECIIGKIPKPLQDEVYSASLYSSFLIVRENN